jgi:branched-chain amino acid transport system ATP-binding protein
MLDVKSLSVSYDAVTAVVDLALTIGSEECVALLGPNGAGKSSTLKAISHLLPHQGTVEFDGTDITRMPADRIARMGLIHVPEGRRLFSELTVHENLQVGTTARGSRQPTFGIDDVYELFPHLAKLRSTRCWSLSGGEQQMVAIGRALMARPRLICMDEPSMGLSPLYVEQTFDIIQEINRQGVSIFMVEQNAAMALLIANRAYVLQTGQVILSGSAAELRENETVREAYLGEMQGGH